jgi:tripartite-type tricarboxylate transporter receptor subunit TctC
MLRHLFAAACLAGVAPQAAHAAYPDRPVMLVAPFPPGGSVDLIARPLAVSMEKLLKQPIVVTNKTGAAGAVGNAYVAAADPDGYKLLLAISSIVTIPEADRLFDRKPAYALSQLAPVARLSADPVVMVVRAEAPWKTVREFVDDAKKKPGALSYSSSGPYGSTHVPAEMLAQSAGVRMRHIPFTGGAPATAALLGGHVDTHLQGLATVGQHIQTGRLRALAGTGAKRIEALPAVPTLKELGHDVEYYVWIAMFAPAKTPPAVLKTVRDAVRGAAGDPLFRTAMDKMITPVQYQDMPEFEKFMAGEVKLLAQVVRKIGRVEDKK